LRNPPPHSRCSIGRAALEEIEAEAIRFAITHYGGRMSEVARRLRIGRSTLYRKLDSLGRDVSDPKTRGNPVTPPRKRPQRRLQVAARQN
jgi:DNA-binding NtrC family response regulator